MDAAVVGQLTGLLGVMVPIVAIVLGIGVAFWSIYWDHQKKRLQYQERQLMIEKGLTPPPMLPDQKKQDHARRLPPAWHHPAVPRHRLRDRHCGPGEFHER